MEDLSQEFRRNLKKAKEYMHAGKYYRAELWCLRARELASNADLRNNMALTDHQLAEIAVSQGYVVLAHRRFMQSLDGIAANNLVGRAILLRDLANFELLQGDEKAARGHNAKALDLLETDQEQLVRPGRRQIELIVTEGFAARIELVGSRNDDAVETLRQVAVTLHGYKKPEYELANLCWLISALPLASPERHQYVIRGMVVCARLRNFKRVGEFAASLGGKQLQDAYRSIIT